jgi:hypothetical protein
VAFLSEPLLAAELDVRPSFCFRAIQAGTLKIISVVLDM